MKSPQEIARKWSRNLANSTDSIKAGVQSVTVSPMELAAKQKDAYLAGVQRAADSGKWERGLRRRDLGYWQQQILGKGLQRISAGAAAAQPSMEQFMAEWLPYEAQLQQQLAQHQRGTLEQNKQRAMMAIDHNAAFKRRS